MFESVLIKCLNDNHLPLSHIFQNGYTALIRAVVFNQLDVANLLCIHRPALRKMPDNVSSSMVVIDRYMTSGFTAHQQY